MIDSEQPVTEEELHAYLDGELAADRRAAVEAWLAAHADDAAKVASVVLRVDRRGRGPWVPVVAEVTLEAGR